MPQGFTPHRHRANQKEESRWAFYRYTIEEDTLPTHPDVLPLVIHALQGRVRRMARSRRSLGETISIHARGDITAMRRTVRKLLKRIEQLDRTRNKELARRIRIYIGVMAQRERWPGEVEENWLYRLQLGHYDDFFKEELYQIEKAKLIAFSCIPAVLRLQRANLYEYMRRQGPDGYAKDDTPCGWLKRNRKRLYEELTFWRCSCRYIPDLWQVDSHQKGPGELIPAILAGLHRGITSSSIRQILKKSARPSKLPSFLA